MSEKHCPVCAGYGDVRVPTNTDERKSTPCPRCWPDECQDIKAMRESLAKLKEARKVERVCRSCKHFDESDDFCSGPLCLDVDYDGNIYVGVDAKGELGAWGEITTPDTFGCNQWEDKP